MKAENNRHVLPGLLLLALGVVWLAINLDWLQLDFWALLWRLWPLILILIGLRFLIRQSSLYALVVLLILGGVVLAAAYAPEPFRSRLRGDVLIQARQELQEPLDNAQHFNFEVDSDTDRLQLSDLTGSRAYDLVVTQAGSVREKVKRTDDQLRVQLGPRTNFANLWRHVKGQQTTLRVTREVPITLQLDSNATRNELDFTQLQLERAKLEVDDSSTDMIFGTKAVKAQVTIEADDTELRLHAPKNVGIEIVTDADLSSQNFERAGLVHEGTTYRSADFASQSRTLTLRLHTEDTAVTLETY